jgi:hypothetical protein
MEKVHVSAPDRMQEVRSTGALSARENIEASSAQISGWCRLIREYGQVNSSSR